MDEEKVPVVFISYCWTNETHMQWVLNLAEQLMEKSGVEVILDRWHGIVGHDRFQFMENSIKKADKVLVICDEMYCRKADNREGGVGTETLIITPDVYQNTEQEKFIPIALSQNSNGEYILPTYFNSRFALGMLNAAQFERDYNQLVRLIWQEPQLKPPVRGSKPNFQDETVTTESPKEIVVVKTDTAEERVVWLLPRGFLIYEDITFNSGKSWSSTVTYYNYDGEWQQGTHYHESYGYSWERDIEIQYRKLSIPEADWNWCRAPLNLLQELREVSKPIDIKNKVSQINYPVYYYAPGDEIPLPQVPDEYSFYYETGDLRDVQQEIRTLIKTSLHRGDEEFHKMIVPIRHSAFLYSLKFLGKDNPSLTFIKEIVDEYKPSLSKFELMEWFGKLDSILTSTLNIEWDAWQTNLKRKKQ